MKNLKEIVLILTVLFAAITIHAQINLPKKNIIKNSKLKKEKKTDLTFLTTSIDGIIGKMLDGRYMIYFSKGGVSCCFKSVKEALNNYPNKRLKYVTSGKNGYVYMTKRNGSIGKKIPNASIAFRNVKSTITHYAHTDEYGNYRISLLPGKYVVTIKKKGYKTYTTLPGFSVVLNKHTTFNIPLKPLTYRSYKADF